MTPVTAWYEQIWQNYCMVCGALMLASGLGSLVKIVVQRLRQKRQAKTVSDVMEPARKLLQDMNPKEVCRFILQSMPLPKHLGAVLVIAPHAIQRGEPIYLASHFPRDVASSMCECAAEAYRDKTADVLPEGATLQ